MSLRGKDFVRACWYACIGMYWWRIQFWEYSSIRLFNMSSSLKEVEILFVCLFADVRGFWKPFKAMMESPGPPLPPRAGITSPGGSGVVSPESAGSGAGVVSPEGPTPNTATGGSVSAGGAALSPGSSAALSPGATVCPSCGSPFDQARKRRLIDTCGHERCYSCMFTSEVCTLCEQNGACVCVRVRACVLSICKFITDLETLALCYYLDCEPSVLEWSQFWPKSCCNLWILPCSSTDFPMLFQWKF